MQPVANEILPYRLEAAAPHEVAWIAHLEASVYSADDAVPQSVLEEWYSSNPKGFFLVKRGAEPVGHLDLLAPRPATLERFLNGEMREREIRGSDLYGPAEREKIRDLYVESLAIALPENQSNVAVIKLLLAGFPHIIRHICDPEKLQNLYAMAATTKGEHMVRRLGLKPPKTNVQRGNRHQIFVGRWADIQDKMQRRR